MHRDVKPENVLVLTGNSETKLVDFGIARRMDDKLPVEDRLYRTAAGVISGSPAYVAPETITGDTIDARTDIYSLGVTLFQEDESVGRITMINNKYADSVKRSTYGFEWAWWSAHNSKKYMKDDDNHRGSAAVDSMSIVGQEEVYSSVGETIKAQLLAGEPVVMFAYGLSGSGKTYTVFGVGDDLDLLDRPARTPLPPRLLISSPPVSLNLRNAGTTSIMSAPATAVLTPPCHPCVAFRMKTPIATARGLRKTNRTLRYDE